MKIGLFGCGAYGMALSSILIENNCDITMWTKFEQEKDQLEKTRQNEKLIPNFQISEKIKLTTNVEECIKGKDLLIIVIPAPFVNSLCLEMQPYIKDNHILIATKGIEQESGLFIGEIVEKTLDTKNIAIISGPSFAVDLVSKKPIGLALASKKEETIKIVKKAFENKYTKLRETDDVIGIEICGSIKNVIALSSGILSGLGANESTKAMLLTEALHDIEEVIDSFDGKKKTILSYAGVGDLILTCTSTKSRNFTFGQLIGERKSTEELKTYLENTTVEGVNTIKSIYKLLKNKKVSIPTINIIYDIVIRGANPEKLLTFLVEKE